jgi:chaperonin GroES
MKFRPLGDRVAIERIEMAEESTGGIYIPDNARDKPQQGTVLAVGPGRRTTQTGELMPMGVKAGDRVLFGKYSGAEVKIDGREVLIAREDEILGVIERSGDGAD